MTSAPTFASLSDRLTAETAAGHLCTLVPTALPDATAGAVRQALLGHHFESIAEVAVLDAAGRLEGLVPIEVLLAAPETARLDALMDADPPVAAPGAHPEVAAWKAVRHGEGSLAVVHPDGTFAGLIPPHRLLTVLLEAHDQDFARIGGFTRDSGSARAASEEAVPRRFWHRIPWLLIGLVGALATAEIVNAFEAQLRRNVLVAVFIPGIVYIADAVGTQTETLIVRGLSIGVPVRRILGRELLTGLAVGIALAVAFVPLGLWRWHEPDLVAAVALALLATCSTATVVALSLPWALHRLGTDPAFASGPLATVIQDLLSILIYLSVVSVMVG